MDATVYIESQLQLPHQRANDFPALCANQLGALIILLWLAPLMLLIAWLIWRHDHGPVLYTQYRVGRNGRLFKCIKFRTMHRDADQLLAQLLQRDPAARAQWESDQKLRHDPRVTPVGAFLRCTSLDELPQLVNVLRGQMNLVGPRPVTVAELTRYGRVRWHYFSIRPGMTGLWQVSGRNNLSYGERVALDRSYIEGHNWLMDLRILLKTVSVIITREGAR